jgi:hypothetical protein
VHIALPVVLVNIGFPAHNDSPVLQSQLIVRFFGKFKEFAELMKKPKLRQGLSLERFAHAKTASYDKQKAKEKAFALNAKKVNKYRKLKQRLAKEGRLVPLARPIVEVLPRQCSLCWCGSY